MKDETPSFDFDEQEHAQAGQGCNLGLLQASLAKTPHSYSQWREVPQPLFLSWSPAMQAAYCRNRDLDAAEHAENEKWEQFYLRRANGYDAGVKA